jgi:pullulanase
MNSNERNFLAYIDEMDIITILLPLSYHEGLSSTFSIVDESQKVRPLQITKKQQIENNNKYICRIDEEISFGHPYWIIDEHGGKTDLQIGAVIRTNAFDERFFYDGNDLGVNCKDSETQFKVWAPTATQVKLKLRQPNSSYSEIIKMRREGNGLWSIVVHSDLELYQYTFLVLVNQEWQESVDPYAVAVTANGELGVIVKLEKTRRKRPILPPFRNSVDAIIYEHILGISPSTQIAE